VHTLARAHTHTHKHAPVRLTLILARKEAQPAALTSSLGEGDTPLRVLLEHCSLQRGIHPAGVAQRRGGLGESPFESFYHTRRSLVDSMNQKVLLEVFGGNRNQHNRFWLHWTLVMLHCRVAIWSVILLLNLSMAMTPVASSSSTTSFINTFLPPRYLAGCQSGQTTRRCEKFAHDLRTYVCMWCTYCTLLGLRLLALVGSLQGNLWMIHDRNRSLFTLYAQCACMSLHECTYVCVHIITCVRMCLDAC